MTSDPHADYRAASRADPRSLPELLGDLAQELPRLLRKEGQLIRAEIAEKAIQVGVGLGAFAAGLVFLLVALNVLAAAMVVALSKAGEPDLGGGWAALIVGIALALIGGGLVLKGAWNMKNLAPERTMHQVARDAQLVKEQVR